MSPLTAFFTALEMESLYRLIGCLLLVFALFVVTVNFAMDLLYILIDPRLRGGAK